jgi:uncharacterized membrane protein YkoI
MLQVRPLTKTSVRLAIVTGAALIAAGPGPARAQAPAVRATRAGAIAPVRLSMAQAVRMVEQRFKARVVRAETRKDGGRTEYVLRLLDKSGRVFTVRVDAASGQIL